MRRIARWLHDIKFSFLSSLEYRACRKIVSCFLAIAAKQRFRALGNIIVRGVAIKTSAARRVRGTCRGMSLFTLLAGIKAFEFSVGLPLSTLVGSCGFLFTSLIRFFKTKRKINKLIEGDLKFEKEGSLKIRI